MNRICIFLAAILCAGVISAQQPGAGGRGGGNASDDGRGKNKRMEKLLERVKKDNPEAYEELMRLRTEDQAAFAAKIREMAQKRMKKHGGQQGPRELGQARNSGEKRGAGNQGTGRRGPGGGMGAVRAQKGKGPLSQRFLEHLREKRPEDFERIRKLMLEDPEAARDEVRQIFGEFSRKHFKQDPGIGLAVKKYRQAQTDEERAAYRQELERAVTEDFDRRFQEKQKRLDETVKRIEFMKAELEKIRAAKEKICNKQVEHLLEKNEDRKKALRHAIPEEVK
ncbi:hypothetical protein BVY04_05105 [bacterium M21]|nr:hypothetical protein BVY04_05105 [bacterium M21]